MQLFDWPRVCPAAAAAARSESSVNIEHFRERRQPAHTLYTYDVLAASEKDLVIQI
jgi:hypothetical protein